MVRVGVHVSIAGGISRAVGRAQDAGCDTFQIFSRNPRGWGFNQIPPVETDGFRSALADSGIAPAVDHMPYLPNLASADPVNYDRSVRTLTAELDRSGELGIPYLVTHLGHHLGGDLAEGRQQVARAITTALSDTAEGVVILLENTAGEKNSVGSRFEEIREVLDAIPDQDRVGVCFDTCHAFGAGYDLRTGESAAGVITTLDEVIGIDRVRVIHMNDAKGELGSGIDRHEHIGLGRIGEEGLSYVLRHPSLSRLPFICETPVDDRRGDVGNIAVVRRLADETGHGRRGR